LAEFRVTEYELGRKMTAEFTAPQMLSGSSETITLETVEGKTKLNLEWNTEFHGFGKLIGPFLLGSIRKTCETEVGTVKRILESESKS